MNKSQKGKKGNGTCRYPRLCHVAAKSNSYISSNRYRWMDKKDYHIETCHAIMRNFQKQLVSDCFYAEQTAFSSGTSYGIQVSSSWFLHRREFIMDK